MSPIHEWPLCGADNSAALSPQHAFLHKWFLDDMIAVISMRVGQSYFNQVIKSKFILIQHFRNFKLSLESFQL